MKRLILLLCLLAFPAGAQTAPDWKLHYVPPPSEWIDLWASKQDFGGDVSTSHANPSDNTDQKTIADVAARAYQAHAVAFRSGISPATHLAKLLASSTPTVCVTGDSTTTLTPNNLAASDILYYDLTRRIREDNPAKTFVFNNDAIGGMSWSQLVGVATGNWPAFYFNHALPWLAYIQAQNCTSIFINMGVNDANGFTPLNFRLALANIVGWGSAPPTWTTGSKTLNTIITDSNGKLQIASTAGASAGGAPTWATTVGASTTDGTVTWQLLSAAVYVPAIPDIVLITNKNTNAAAGPPYSTALNQNGTIAAASYQRTTALAGGAGLSIASLPPLGLIDIGRFFTMAYNGYDPAAQTFTKSIPSTAPITGINSFPYTLPVTTGGDFDLSLTLPNGSVYTPATAILVSTGDRGDGFGGFVKFQGNGSGLGTTINIDNLSGAGQVGVFVAASWTTGNNTLRVTAKGGHLLIQVNGVVVMDVLSARFVNSFAPVISFVGTAIPTPAMTINFYSTSVPLTYAPLVRAVDCFGLADFTGAGGGNGINHDASACINLVDVAVLDATRFAP